MMWKKIAKQFLGNWEWFKKFFNSKTAESMMRLLDFICVRSGILIIWYCTITKTEGYAHYGLELAILGILGKAYQEYNIGKQNNNGNNLHTGTTETDSQEP